MRKIVEGVILSINTGTPFYFANVQPYVQGYEKT